jgi:hypothetical protein
MPNIANFLLGDAIHIGEDSWKVKVCHVLKSKLPKLFIFIGVIFGVIPRVFITSAVAQPDVIASICQHKCRCLVLIVDKPRVRTIKESMLEDDWFEAFSNNASFSLDSEHGEDIAILGDHFMGLDRIMIVFAVVHELKLCFRMRGVATCKQKRQIYED